MRSDISITTIANIAETRTPPFPFMMLYVIAGTSVEYFAYIWFCSDHS